jgi:predicted glycosyl hydrolase (DUF1957 family)
MMGLLSRHFMRYVKNNVTGKKSLNFVCDFHLPAVRTFGSNYVLLRTFFVNLEATYLLLTECTPYTLRCYQLHRCASTCPVCVYEFQLNSNGYHSLMCARAYIMSHNSVRRRKEQELQK